MKTLCSHCVFYEKQEKRCHLDLLEKAKFEMTDGGPVIEGLCRSCRNVYWPEIKDGTSMEVLAYKVREENKLEYDVVIGYDILDEQEDLIKTIDSINQLSIQPKTVIISSNRHYLLNQSLWAELTQKYTNLKFFVSFCGFDSYQYLLDYALNKVQSEFVLNTVCGCIISNITVSVLNEQVNMPSFFLAFFRNSEFYFAERDILKFAFESRPKEVSTLDHIKNNMSHIGSIIEELNESPKS